MLPSWDQLQNELKSLPIASLLPRLQMDQVERWKAQQPVLVEEYLQYFPVLQNDSEGVLVLILGEVLQREASDQRVEEKEYLDRFPTYSEALRMQLAFHQAMGIVTSLPLTDTGSQMHTDTEPRDLTGMIIADKYKLREHIGEGGMGTVWRAEQLHPVKRQVALKLIKPGMDSKAVLTRFEAERQALAVMDHPNIAKVLDAGITINGMPFFVMELVKGTPITIYCDTAKLTPRERLELFVPVCHAIQHAHQKGIIHRDIKPSNVLIALYDEKPVPKVIDFGVAKATQGQLTEATLETGIGNVIGTPEYMSPEQASLNNLDIDTRSDVYSLGALLYELLAGSPPFKAAEYRQAGLLEMLRMVREEDPPRPSTILSTAEGLPGISASRATEPRRLTGILRNELDWIVMKALEKERARRYESASGFAADLQRFLDGEAVLAHPPSAIYRMTKLVRRHKVKMIAAGLIVFTILAGIVGTTWGMLQAQSAREAEARQRTEAERERDGKEQARQAAVVEKERADTERKISDEVRHFITDDIFGQTNDPSLGKLSELKVKALLDRAAGKISNRFADQPAVEAAVRFSIFRGYYEIGLAEQGRIHLERALELYRSVRGTKHLDTYRAMMSMAQLDLITSQGDQGESLGREAYAGFKQLLGEGDPVTLQEASRLVVLLSRRGLNAEALELCQSTAALNRKIQPFNQVLDEKLQFQQIDILLERQEYLKAEPLACTYFETIYAKYGNRHLYAYRAAAALMRVLENTDRRQLAETLGVEWLDRAVRFYGADHHEATFLRHSLGDIYSNEGKFLQAGLMYLDASRGYRLFQGLRSEKGRLMQSYAVEALAKVQQLDVARKRADSWASSELPEQLFYASCLYAGLANAANVPVAESPDARTSIELLRKAIDRGFTDYDSLVSELNQIANHDDFHNVTTEMNKQKPSAYPRMLSILGKSQINKSEFAQAINTLKHAISLLEKQIDVNTRDAKIREVLGDTYDQLGDVYFRTKYYTQAETYHHKSLEQRLILRRDHKDITYYGSQVAWSHHNLGATYCESKNHAKAIEAFREAVALREELLKNLPARHSYRNDLGRDLEYLATAYKKLGQLDSAVQTFRCAYQVRRAHAKIPPYDGERNWFYNLSMQQLAAILEDTNQLNEALAVATENIEFLQNPSQRESLDSAGRLERYASILMKQKNWIEAEKALREALAIRHNKDPKGWELMNDQTLLGSVLLAQKKHSEAESFLVKGCQGLGQLQNTLPADQQDRLSKSIDSLIQLYTVTNKHEDVKKWQAEKARLTRTK